MSSSLSLRFATIALGLLSYGTGYAQTNETTMADHSMKADHAIMADHSMKADHAMKADAEITTVDLVQTPGQFTTEHLDLTAGQYRFRVANEGVDHEVGFFIQRAADKDGAPGETAVENSFTQSAIPTGGTSETGVVTLAPGQYVYSCPLNPTPHYTITVK